MDEINETLISYGGEVKAIGDGKVGGYLVRFSTEADPDLSNMRDYFDAKTNLGRNADLDTYYHHGLDPVLSDRVIGETKTRPDDVGLWAETQLNMRDEYERAIYALAEAGKLGYSSGAVSHLVKRVEVGNGVHYIKSWPIGEASLTPTPAEPRNTVVSLKSLPTAPAFASGQTTQKEGNKMDEIQAAVKAALDAERAEQKAAQDRAAELEAARIEGAKQAVEELKSQGALKHAPGVISELGKSDEGVAGFMHYIKTGQKNGDLVADTANIKAAYNITTDASGAYAVPDPLYNQIIAKRDIASWVRQAPTQKFTTDSDHLLIPVEATSQTAFVLTAESAAYSNNEGTLGQVDLKLLKYTKEVRATEEFLAGNNSNAESWLMNTLARAVAVTENTLATTAILATSTAATAAAAAAALTIPEIYRLIGSLGGGYNVNGECGFLTKNSTKWYLKGVEAVNYQMADILAGYPAYVSDDMAAVTNSARSTLFANFNYFAVLERPGMSVRRNDFLYMANGQIGLFANIYRGFAGLQALATYTMAQAA
jgi:HK97 family phage major capsid protein